MQSSLLSLLGAAALTTTLALAAAAPAVAADAAGAAQCGILVRSPLLNLPTPEMQQQVTLRLDRSVQVANAASTITSTSPRFVWASEAKVACGIAVGFFGGGEVNEEAVSKCDCFYGRMLTYTGALR